MVSETRVQCQVETRQRLKKWCLISSYLILSIIRYGSWVKWSNPLYIGEVVIENELSGRSRLRSQTSLYFLYIYIYGLRSHLSVYQSKVIIYTSLRRWPDSHQMSLYVRTLEKIWLEFGFCIFNLNSLSLSLYIYIYIYI